MPASKEIPSPSCTTIRAITYNCLGLKFISKHRKQRLAEIGAQLAAQTPPPDIVGLQECWCQEDYMSIRQQTRDFLPYGKFYYSGVFGAGLAILSKWPIEESSMFRYTLNGRPTAFFRGDWYVGKGVACVQIRYGQGEAEMIQVFCTHLHAPYESEPHDSYLCHRTAQAWEIAKLMRGAVSKGHLVLGLGDFNMLPLSLAHCLIENHGLVKDAWRILHPESSLGPANHPDELARGRKMPTAEYNLTENGAASDGVLNTWRWSKAEQRRLQRGEKVEIDPDTPDPHAKRLDYIFVGGDPTWHVQDMHVGMTARHPRLHCSLSDHFSIHVSLVRQTHLSNSCSTNRPDSLAHEFYDSILAMTSTYTSREYNQRWWRLAHFLLSVLVTIACFIAVFWSPRSYVSFILMLASTLGLGSGIIDGLIGGLFMTSEIRALKEFEWEIQNAKSCTREEPNHSDATINE